MPHSFEQKLERANQHLQSFDRQILRWMERKPYRTIDEFDPEKGCRVFSLEPVGRTPEHLAIELGRTLQFALCARSSRFCPCPKAQRPAEPKRGKRGSVSDLPQQKGVFQKGTRAPHW